MIRAFLAFVTDTAIYAVLVQIYRDILKRLPQLINSSSLLLRLAAQKLGYMIVRVGNANNPDRTGVQP